jgi:hypothetical protein
MAVSASDIEVFFQIVKEPRVIVVVIKFIGIVSPAKFFLKYNF